MQVHQQFYKIIADDMKKFRVEKSTPSLLWSWKNNFAGPIFEFKFRMYLSYICYLIREKFDYEMSKIIFHAGAPQFKCAENKGKGNKSM